MKKIIFFILLLLPVFFSAIGQTSYQKIDTSLTRAIWPKKTKPSLNNIINDIGSYPTVDAGEIGYLGSTSAQYNKFVTLMSIATDSQLIVLTNYFNPNVKAYAFWALVIRRHVAVKRILEEHINDKCFFQYRSGCMSESMKINEWFLGLAAQVLTNDEIKKISAAIKS
jgi:hypothetical protein